MAATFSGWRTSAKASAARTWWTSSVRTTTRSAGECARTRLATRSLWSAPSFGSFHQNRARLTAARKCMSTVSDVTKRKSALTGARAASPRAPPAQAYGSIWSSCCWSPPA